MPNLIDQLDIDNIQPNLWSGTLWRDPQCQQGMKDMLQLLPGFGMWGIVTGVAMAQSELPIAVSLLMGFLVFSAGAQLAAVPLMVVGAPLWIIWLTAACVNLRFVIFSAQTRRHLSCLRPAQRLMAGYVCADLPYVMLMNKYGKSPPASKENPAPLAYFCGLVAVNWTAWHASFVIGVLCAHWIPASWGLGFAGTLALLALLATMMLNRQSGMIAMVACIVAVAAYALPFKLYVVTAVLAAVCAGWMLDRLKLDVANDAATTNTDDT